MADTSKLDCMSRDVVVDTNMIGPGKIMKLPEALRQFQQVGMDHLEAANHGLNVMEELHQAFLTSKNSVRIHRLPSYLEKVTVQTCTPRFEGLFNVRYYRMLDAKGNLLADSYSYWTLVDTESKKIIRPNRSDHSYLPMTEAFTVSAGKPSRLVIPENMEKAASRTVLPSETDQYGHMNNTRYVDVIADYADGADIAAIDMTYYHEMPLGTQYNVCRFRDDKTVVLAFSPEGGNVSAISFAAKITIR